MKSGDIQRESIENGTEKPHKKSALRMLRRHLTKVNPLPQNTSQHEIQPRSTNGHIGKSAPLPSTADAFRSKIINSNYNNVSDNSPSLIHRNYLANTNNTNTNKISHQIGLCCSVDDRAGTPIEKISVKYKSLPDIQLRNCSIKHLATTIDQPVLTNHNRSPVNRTNVETSKSHTRTPEPFISSDQLKIKVDTSHSTKHCQVSKNECQNSIAVSACRSRFRQQILTGNTETLNEINLPTDHRKLSCEDGVISNVQSSSGLGISVPVYEKMNAATSSSIVVASTDKTKKRSLKVNYQFFL